MGDQGQQPLTTIPPFGNTQVFPACAVNCGPLYDANGACVPPINQVNDPAAWNSCFCANGAVNALSTAATAVCNQACADPAQQSSIAVWFRSLCSVTQGNDASFTTTDTLTSASGIENVDETDGPNRSNMGGGGDWLSGHWQWVVMLVILVVAIAGGWVGACIWRRRHLKKKDRQSSLGQKHSGSASRPSWGPPVSGTSDPQPAVFATSPNTQSPAYDVEKQPKEKVRKSWTVGSRT